MRWLAIVAMMATLGCSKGSESGSTGPGSNGEPSNNDWAALSSQLAAIGADAFQAALVSAGVTTSSADRVHVSAVTAPSSPVAGSATYFCCGSSLVKNATVASTLTIASGGSIALVQAFAGDDLGWMLNGSPTPISISVSGVTLAGTLATSGGVVNGVQQLQLTGTVTYTLTNGEKKTATFEVGYAYSTYPTGGPTGTGHAGPAPISGSSSSSTPARCTTIPREGCPPCTTGGCGSAPCGSWPACPK